MKSFNIILFLSLNIIQSLVAQDNSVFPSDHSTIFDEAKGKNGMVITNSAQATQTAINILRKGGNAVDAAIAANAVLGVTEPTSGGIGGDLFALIWDAKTKQLYGLDASGRSPKSLSYEKLKSLKINKITGNSPLSITVPGCVDGWYEMYQKFGRLPEYEILADAINLAENGFIVNDEVVELWDKEAERLGRFTNFSATFLEEGHAPDSGAIFRNPDLAGLYRTFSEKGFRSFYEKDFNQIISQSVIEAGGYLTTSDISMYHSEWVDPISTDYKGYEIYQLPPNGMGINLLNLLNIIENFNLAQLGFGTKKYLHTLIEVKKLAYQDQDRFFEDPTFKKYAINSFLTAENARKKLNNFSATYASIKNYNYIDNESNTISIIVVDQEANIVVLTQNNYIGMGSGIVPKGLGFVLQNRASAFSIKKSDANVYAAGKRPYFSAIPCMIMNNSKPLICLSLTDNQLNALTEAQLIINIIDFKMQPKEAMSVPYIFHSQHPDKTIGNKKTDWSVFEKGINYQVVRELISMGHRIKFTSVPVKGLQALFIQDKNTPYFGMSRSSEDGYVVGY